MQRNCQSAQLVLSLGNRQTHNPDSKLIYPYLCRISSHSRYFPGHYSRERTRLCAVTQSILGRDPVRFHHLAIRSYRWPNSEVRYRTAPNLCSTSSSLALRRARFHFDRENRCQSPSRCCRILADCRCCSCKRDRRGTRSALSLSGPSSAQPVAERFGAAALVIDALEGGNQTDRQIPQGRFHANRQR